jgi:Ni2+-binding GTPase involved in maturation of urease and hydrogenase
MEIERSEEVVRVKRQVLAINPHPRIIEMSCRTGTGLDAWCEWLIEFALGDASDHRKGR